MLRRLSFLALAASVIGLLAMSALLCRYAWPALDDYAIDQMVRDKGLWGAQIHWYTEWQGKFAGVLAMSLFPWAFDLVHGYPFAPALILLLFVVGLTWLVRALLPTRSLLECLGAALVMLAVFLANVPSPVEAVYWMTGSYAYQSGLIAALVLIALLVTVPATRLGRWLNGIAAVAAAAWVAGSTETIMLPAASIALLWSGLVALGRVRRTPRGIAVATTILLAGLVVVLAPGNAIRSEYFVEHSHDLVRAVSRSFERAGKYAAIWSATASMVGAALLFAPACCRARQRVVPLRFRFSVPILFVLLAIAFFPAFWATGYGPPPRAMSAIWCMFALGWFLVLVPALADWLGRTRLVQLSRHRQAAGAIVLAAGLCLQGNSRAAVQDLIAGRAQAYHAENQARHRQLVKAARDGSKVVLLPPLTARPELLFMGDITTDPADWTNRVLAYYYGLDSVAIEPSSPR